MGNKFNSCSSTSQVSSKSQLPIVFRTSSSQDKDLQAQVHFTQKKAAGDIVGNDSKRELQAQAHFSSEEERKNNIAKSVAVSYQNPTKPTLNPTSVSYFEPRGDDFKAKTELQNPSDYINSNIPTNTNNENKTNLSKSVAVGFESTNKPTQNPSSNSYYYQPKNNFKTAENQRPEISAVKDNSNFPVTPEILANNNDKHKVNISKSIAFNPQNPTEPIQNYSSISQFNPQSNSFKVETVSPNQHPFVENNSKKPTNIEQISNTNKENISESVIVYPNTKSNPSFNPTSFSQYNQPSNGLKGANNTDTSRINNQQVNNSNNNLATSVYIVNNDTSGSGNNNFTKNVIISNPISKSNTNDINDKNITGDNIKHNTLSKSTFTSNNIYTSSAPITNNSKSVITTTNKRTTTKTNVIQPDNQIMESLDEENENDQNLHQFQKCEANLTNTNTYDNTNKKNNAKFLSTSEYVFGTLNGKF